MPWLRWTSSLGLGGRGRKTAWRRGQLAWALREGSGSNAGQHGRRAFLAEGTAEAKAQGHESSKQLVVPSAQRGGRMRRCGGDHIEGAGPDLTGPRAATD